MALSRRLVSEEPQGFARFSRALRARDLLAFANCDGTLDDAALELLSAPPLLRSETQTFGNPFCAITTTRRLIVMRIARALRVRADELAARAFANSVACNYAVNDLGDARFLELDSLPAPPPFDLDAIDPLASFANWSREIDEMLVTLDAAYAQLSALPKAGPSPAPKEPHAFRWSPGDATPLYVTGSGADSFDLHAVDVDTTVLFEDGATHALRTGRNEGLDSVVVSLSHDAPRGIDLMRWTHVATLTGVDAARVHGARLLRDGDFLTCGLKAEAIVEAR